MVYWFYVEPIFHPYVTYIYCKKAVGVSRGVISNIEYEKTEPQPLVIRAICNILRIDETWLVSGQGEMAGNSELEKSAWLLSEIYNSAKALSEEEQDYILDMIKTFQKHRDNILDSRAAKPLSDPLFD